MDRDKYEYTMLSEVIEMLQSHLDKHGDTVFTYNGVSPVYLDCLPYFYDGGFAVKEKDKPNYIGSKQYGENGGHKHPDLPDHHVFLTGFRGLEDDESKDGRSARDIEECWSFLDDQENEERKIFSGELIKYKRGPDIVEDKNTYLGVIAYLDCGLSVHATNMAKAKEELIKLYKEQQSGSRD